VELDGKSMDGLLWRLVGTKLTELSLPEEKVLEGLNAVSTAKRIANMVNGFLLKVLLFVIDSVCRSYTIRTLENAKRFMPKKLQSWPNSTLYYIRVPDDSTICVRHFIVYPHVPPFAFLHRLTLTSCLKTDLV
jgi:hypothetical protein